MPLPLAVIPMILILVEFLLYTMLAFRSFKRLQSKARVVFRTVNTTAVKGHYGEAVARGAACNTESG